MAKVLVTYYSRTGNTEKVAHAIYEEIGDSKTIKPINELDNEDMENHKLLFIGFPVYSHSVPFMLEKPLRSIPSGKKIALFSTHGSFRGSPLSKEALEYASTLASRAVILGTFSCRGKVSPQAMEQFEKTPEHQSWAEMAASAATHPDKSDLEEAQEFARRILDLSY